MELLEPNLQVLIWTVAVFIGLVAILGKFAWGPLEKALKEREERIARKISDADAAHKEALAKMADYEKKINAAKDEASAIIAEGKRDVEKVSEEIKAAANAEAARTLERAKREIELAKQTAVAELRDRMVDLTAELASTVIEREIKPEDHRRFIQEALGKIEKN